MNLVPSPDPAGIPGPALVFELLLLFTQTAHVAFMNFALGGSWFLLWLQFDRKTEWKDRLYRRCLAVMPVAISMTITFGVAPLLFVQVLYGQFFYTANVLMGGFWLSVPALLVPSFYGVYLLKARTGDGRSEWLSRSGGRVATHLFIAVGFTLIAFLLTANAVLTVSPEMWEKAHLGSTLGTIVTESPFFWPRFLHNVIGAPIIAGLWIVWIANHRREPNDERAIHGARAGATLGAVATFPQIAIGVWYTLALPAPVTEGLFDLESQASIHLVSGVITAILLFFCLGLLTVISTHRNLRWIATVSGAASLMAMITASEGFRELLLKEYVSEPTVHSQPGPFWIFLLLFVVGCGTLGWILRVIWKDGETDS